MCTAARSSIRAAIRRSKSTSCSTAARVGRAAVPSGASTGQREALELRDGDKKRYLGQGRHEGRRPRQRRDRRRRWPARDARQRARRRGDDRARRHRRTRAGSAPTRCSACRWPLARADGGRGGRAALRAPRAAARRRTTAATVLPVPMMNILNGGAHADSSVDFQEFMVMPVGAPSFARGAAHRRRDLPHAARHPEEDAALSTGVGDEGGFAPSLSSNREALDVVLEAVAQGRLPGRRRRLPRARRRVERVLERADAARYEFKKSGEQTRDAEEMVALYDDWVRRVPDHLDRGRRAPKATGTAGRCSPRRSATRVQLVGDDLFVTNPEILARGIERGHRQLDPGQAQSDRHRHRDARRDRDGVEGRLRQHHLASLRRDRGHDHRRPRGRHRRRPDQDRLGEPQRSRRPSTTSCCASKKSSARPRSYAGRAAIKQLVAI